jgi:hypothetical protein
VGEELLLRLGLAVGVRVPEGETLGVGVWLMVGEASGVLLAVELGVGVELGLGVTV